MDLNLRSKLRKIGLSRKKLNQIGWVKIGGLKVSRIKIRWEKSWEKIRIGSIKSWIKVGEIGWIKIRVVRRKIRRRKKEIRKKK